MRGSVVSRQEQRLLLAAYMCCGPTWLQLELTSQWEQRRSWQGCVSTGWVRSAQRWGWTMVERSPKLCLHWSCLCWTPRPQDTLHSDHELASQLWQRRQDPLKNIYKSFKQRDFCKQLVSIHNYVIQFVELSLILHSNSQAWHKIQPAQTNWLPCSYYYFLYAKICIKCLYVQVK